MISQGNPTLLDVAKQAGVSKATVSMVLNNSTLISPKTHEKVRAAIEGLRYQPNEAARKLARKRWAVEAPAVS